MFRYIEGNPYEYIKAYTLELVWSTCQDCYIIYNNDTPVALLDGIFCGSNDLFIIAFETFKKSVGIGSQIVEELKAGLSHISLYPNSERSKQFWANHGFQPNEDEGEDVICMEYYAL